MSNLKVFKRLLCQDGCENCVESEYNDEWINKVIIQNHETREFTVFEKSRDLVKFMKKLPANKKYYSEVIPGNKMQKIRFDLDFPDKKELNLDEDFKAECFKELMRAIVKTFKQLEKDEWFDIETKLRSSNVHVYNGSVKVANRHIIINGFCVADNLQAKEIYRKIRS